MDINSLLQAIDVLATPSAAAQGNEAVFQAAATHCDQFKESCLARPQDFLQLFSLPQLEGKQQH